MEGIEFQIEKLIESSLKSMIIKHKERESALSYITQLDKHLRKSVELIKD